MCVRRVLIADRDPDSRTVYRILLEHRGYQVLETADGRQALVMAREAGVSVVVTELSLDGMDGHELLTRLRRDPDTADLPVLVLTARGVPEERARAQREGCTRFLVKPLEPNALVRVLGSVLPPVAE